MASLRAAERDSHGDSDPPSPPSPIGLLSYDPLRLVFARLPLCDALACRPVCRLFRDALAPASPLALPALRLLALRTRSPSLHAFDFARNRWLRLPLSFLPFPSLTLLAASGSLLFLRADDKPVTLVACNPLTRAYRVLPPLDPAWLRHPSVLGTPAGAALLLSETAALSYTSGADAWLETAFYLSSRPRSPVLVGATVYTLVDAGTPWRSRWLLVACPLRELSRGWAPIERPEWGDVLNILKRPRLIRSIKASHILMVGGLRSSYEMDAPCSAVVILRLDMETMEWDEAGRMPSQMYESFGGGGGACGHKVEVFGGDGSVCFSAAKVKGRMAMWEEGEDGGGGRWIWLDDVPGDEDGAYRGFVFDAGLNDVP